MISVKSFIDQGTDRRNHSTAGGDYLKDEVGITDRVVLDCVKYHHAAMLKGAALDDNSLAYIVYLADNIAALLTVERKRKVMRKDLSWLYHCRVFLIF